jgi:hypothetical protein
MSKVIDTFFGGAEKKAGRDIRRGQEAAGRLTAAQLAQTEEEFAPFINQQAGQSLNAQRILLGLGGTPQVDPNAGRRQELQSQIDSLLSQERAGSRSEGLSKFFGQDVFKEGSQPVSNTAEIQKLQEELNALPEFDANAQGTAREQQAQAFQNFAESPGVQFAREQGLRGIESESAVTGGLGGGQRLRELTRFSQGLALQDFSNQFNRLGATSQGEQALIGRQQAAQTGLASLRAGFGAQQAGTLIGAGQARGEGRVAQAAGLRTGITQLANIGQGAITGGASGALQGFTGN